MLITVALVACGASERDDPALAFDSGGNGNAASAGLGSTAGRDGNGGSAGRTQLPAPMGASGEAGAACEREVSLEAVTLDEPQPFDLVIVADHSASLAWSRDELANGLADLLANVAGRDVRVFLLTPTQYGASSAAAVAPRTGEPIVAWQDPETGEAYQGAATEYEQRCTDYEETPIDCPSPIGLDPYVVYGSWRFVMPAPIARVTADMSQAEFEAEQAKVKDEILAIGGTGAPEEMPLCTLSRYVTQDPASLPENAVFLVISDEDDVSVPDDCLVGFTGGLKHERLESAAEPCTENCDAYRWTVDGDAYERELSYECAAFDDLGNLIPGSEQNGTVPFGRVPDCGTFLNGPCDTSGENSVRRFCDSGKELTQCTAKCSPALTSCSVQVEDPELDPCTEPFPGVVTEYENLADYCAMFGSNWRNCRKSGLNRVYVDSYSSSYFRQSLMGGTTTADIGAYFRTQASRVFPASRYLLEAIVFDERFACEMGPGQSHATNLISVVADDSKVFPLCESFAPALEGVWDFAQALIQTEFPLALKDDEHVTSVVVIASDGTERVLPADAHTYDPERALLSVDEDALGGSDASLRVEITSDCRPVVR